MSQFQGYKVSIQIIVIATLLNFTKTLPQDTSTTIKPGRYVPELHGGLRGKWTPDDSGKYVHIHRPYDGGYGDRGLKYVHDASGNIFVVKADGGPGILPLSDKDRLRFMVDFNYEGSGWQIIKFEWLRDGDESHQFNFVNENQLFSGNNGHGKAYVPPADNGDDGTAGDSESESATKTGSEESDAHIDGEYDKARGYDYSVTDRKDKSNNENLKNAIKDVLEYIEVNILPTL
ncbi:uncharacterized protein LOC131801689 [Musca domestica]|uniref:Uncharacterized protein LOC131801689 n=1 Tax=Musca domestica TaxID=7370 RepID=A0ABM3USU0_MUSDO|nr:uncharacterized protein LOC131801689 [Musca domestica]